MSNAFAGGNLARSTAIHFFEVAVSCPSEKTAPAAQAPYLYRGMTILMPYSRPLYGDFVGEARGVASLTIGGQDHYR